MGVGPVSGTAATASSVAPKLAEPPAGDTSNWRLAAAHAAKAQGLVVSPYGHLPEADAFFLTLAPGRGGGWIEALRAVCPMTDASGKATDDDGNEIESSALAFTWTGLAALGLDEATLATFSDPFREGMRQIDRQRRLSDDDASGLIVPGGPCWSGNTPDTMAGVPGAETDPPVPPTALTVHALLLLYAATGDELDTLCAGIASALDGGGVTIVRRLRLSLRLDETNRAREHFGFADGISQPSPRGAWIVPKSGEVLLPDPLNGVPSGDILIGHCNAAGEASPGPMIDAARDPGNLLTSDGAPTGFHNFGLDGSYLVARELRQDVAAFWNAMYTACPASSPDDAIALASRVVGRTMDGDMLSPAGNYPPAGGQPANDFRFFSADQHGLGCPIGSHVRRANPRDGLARDANSTSDLLRAANNHRILRRGRKFGSTIADPRKDDGEDRGLLFMCLNTDLVRQFEFVQQTWLLNQNFGTLLGETDPLLGPKGRFTIPGSPLRARPTVETFVRFAGGEYFFLPSLPALDYLQTLPKTSLADPAI